MNENNNSNNNPYEDWGFSKTENEVVNNQLNTNNNVNMNNINSNNPNTDMVNKNINTTTDSTNKVSNNISSILKEEKTKSIATDIFFKINMKFIVPGLIVFGSFYALFGAFRNSKIIYILILLFCFGYSILIITLFIINTIKEDVDQNGFSIFGKNKKDKINSIFILCIIVLYLMRYLYGKFFVK